MKDQYLNAFQTEILEILENQKEGISEYELIRLLGEKGHERFSGSFLGNEPELFRAHFILFNTLYKMRQHLRERDEREIEISAVKIIIHSGEKAQEGLQEGCGVAPKKQRIVAKHFLELLLNISKTSESELI